MLGVSSVTIVPGGSPMIQMKQGPFAQETCTEYC
jgi:hypothetical protein